MDDRRGLPRVPDVLVAQCQRRLRLACASLDGVRPGDCRRDQPAARPCRPDHDAGGPGGGTRRQCAAAARDGDLVARPRRRRRPRLRGRGLPVGADGGRCTRRPGPSTVDGRVPGRVGQAHRHRRVRSGDLRLDPGTAAGRGARSFRRTHPARTPGLVRPRQGVDDNRHRPAPGSARRPRHRDDPPGGRPGDRHAGPRDALTRDSRRYRPRPPDPAVHRQPRRAAVENALGGRRGIGSAHGGRELVGDMAGASSQRHRHHRSRRPAAGAWRAARRGDRTSVSVPCAAAGVAGDPPARAGRGLGGLRRRGGSFHALDSPAIRRAGRDHPRYRAGAAGTPPRSRRALPARPRHRAALAPHHARRRRANPVGGGRARRGAAKLLRIPRPRPGAPRDAWGQADRHGRHAARTRPEWSARDYRNHPERRVRGSSVRRHRPRRRRCPDGALCAGRSVEPGAGGTAPHTVLRRSRHERPARALRLDIRPSVRVAGGT